MPIFKKLKTIDICQYITSIFEDYGNQIYNRLTKYIVKHNVLSNSQFGFKKGHSTYMALTILIDKTIRAMDKREHTIGLFLDFAKTFDTVLTKIFY